MILYESVIKFFCTSSSWIQIDIDGFSVEEFLNGTVLIQKWTLLICSVIGIGQFIPYLFKKYPTLHFAIGSVYVMLVLIFSAPTSIIYGIFQKEILDLSLWILLGLILWRFTRKGLKAIVSRSWSLHLQYMVISYVIVLMLTSRLYLKTFESWCVNIALILILCIALRRSFVKMLLQRFLSEN
jgi:hypothetical protein